MPFKKQNDVVTRFTKSKSINTKQKCNRRQQFILESHRADMVDKLLRPHKASRQGLSETSLLAQSPTQHWRCMPHYPWGHARNMLNYLVYLEREDMAKYISL